MTRLALLATGLASPLGPAPVAAAALRAGLSRARELPWAPVLGLGEDAAPAVGHPAVDAPAEDAERISALLARLPAPPAADAVVVVGPLADADRMPADPGPVAQWLGGRPCTACPGGHAGLARALVEASRRERTLVVAVDSLVGADALAWLHDAGRLRGPDQGFGLSPGEAAAWWLVGPEGTPGAIAGVRAGWQATGGTRAPADDADRLWAAAAQAGVDPAGDAVDAVDLTGEPWRERTWGALLPRLAERRQVLQPAAGWGDLGAAGAAAAGCALLAWRGARPAAATIWSLAEDGSAGVVVLG